MTKVKITYMNMFFKECEMEIDELKELILETIEGLELCMKLSGGKLPILLFMNVLNNKKTLLTFHNIDDYALLTFLIQQVVEENCERYEIVEKDYFDFISLVDKKSILVK